MILPLLAACNDAAGPVEVSVIGGEPDLSIHHGNAPQRLPNPAGYGVIAAARAGLVGFDAEGRIVPALAERWIVTDDARGYIFRLRDGQWSDGSAINAADVAAGLRRALDGLRGTPLAADFAGVRAVKVMARRVIEIDLDAPQPDFLTLLAQPELGIVGGPKANRVAATMELKRNGDRLDATLVAADRPGLSPVPPPAVTRPVAVRFVSATDAVARFVAGKADVVVGGTFDSLPSALAVATARGRIQVDPVAGLFGLDVARADGFLADAANREALAMAIDRDALIAAFGVTGWQATTRIVSAGLEGDNGAVSERWTDQTLDQRRATASARVAAWMRKAAPAQSPVVTLALPDGLGADLVFGRLHDDLGAIGVTLVRVRAGEAADLVLVDRVARYDRARWFLTQLGCVAHPVVCSRDGDVALAAALTNPDPAMAAQSLGEAEGAITMANGFIPLARPLRWSLTRGSVAGFAANPWGWHALPPLAGAELPAPGS